MDHKDIDYFKYTKFSKNFSVKVDSVSEMDDFLTPQIQQLIEDCGIDHLESNGEALLLFCNNFQLAQLPEYTMIIDFVEEFKKLVRK